MIDIDTVFILGAGASNPYGYPTGNGLRKAICSNFTGRFSGIFRMTRTSDLKATWTSKADQLATIFNKSSTPSIDLFLARNNQFSDVGKLAIILSIFDAERASEFREKSEKPDHDWYTYLFHRMSKTLIDPESYKNFSNNKVTFITFNYDRSLEQFFYESLINSFSSAREDEIVEEIKKIPIFHVYGKITNLPWESIAGTEIKYLSVDDDPYRKFEFDFLQRIKSNIRIIHEREHNDWSAIHEKLSAAKRIFFLGFGYASENLDALEINNTLSHEQQIFGTALGLLKKEIEDVRTSISANFELKSALLNNLRIIDTDCVTLLREYL